jgi:hypothetical protein
LFELLEAFGYLFAAACGVGLAVGTSLRRHRPQCGLALFGVYVSRKVGIDKNVDDAPDRDHRKAHDDPHVHVHAIAFCSFWLPDSVIEFGSIERPRQAFFLAVVASPFPERGRPIPVERWWPFRRPEESSPVTS